MPKRILVTGKSGQLGRSLQKLAPLYPEFQFEFVGRTQLDLSSNEAIRAFFATKQPFYAIINTAAYTAVDKAESEQELANQVNHLAVKELANIAQQQGSLLLHVSTDYVFSGKYYRPYIESDKVSPVNCYGESKLLGEQAMQASECAGAIVRTSWVYSEFGNNFVKTMLRLGTEREKLNVIFDQIGSPTYATDLADALLHVLKNITQQASVEVYHFSNEGVCSWFDFAQAIFELSNISCQLNSIETSCYPTPAKRPHFSLLNKAKIKQAFGLDIPYWRNSLISCLAEIQRIK